MIKKGSTPLFMIQKDRGFYRDDILIKIIINQKSYSDEDNNKSIKLFYKKINKLRSLKIN